MKTVELKCVQTFHDNGKIATERYQLDGKPHNENGPACKGWFPDGKVEFERYLKFGQHHNENGPQYRLWDEYGMLKVEQFWLDGLQYSKEEWEEKIKGCNPSGKTVTIDGKKYRLEPVE